MLHRANTATTYSLAFLEILEKILIIHWYMWLYCLLSAIIIHTEDLLHCKWWKPESRGKKNRTERKRKKADGEVERMRVETPYREIVQTEKARESHLCPVKWWAKCLQLCVGVANQSLWSSIFLLLWRK